jgi:hypothetical protein
MTDAQRQLLRRIFASRHFANAESLRRVLQYLCDHAEDPDAPREYDIALTALGRPSSFDPKTDPIVRIDIAQIRERLQAYFAVEGVRERLRLAVPKGQYRPVFFDAGTTAALPRSESPALQQFWAPYLGGDADALVVFSETLFLRNDAGTFVRNIYVNELGSAREELQARTGLDVGGYKPTYHFVSAGEMHALLALSRMFMNHGARFETRNARFSSWNMLGPANLILLGSSRTNSFLDSLQSGEELVITSSSIENRRPRAGERDVYGVERRTDGKLEKVTEYAVVTRRPGLAPGTAVTSIAANHGRAIEGAAELLTNEGRLAGLLASLDIDRPGAVPDRFQLLLRVDMIDFDDEVVEVACVAHRLPQAMGVQAP